LIKNYEGDLALGSPEKERQAENNKYLLEWRAIESLKDLNVFPLELKNILLKKE